MSAISPQQLESLFRPRSVALVGAANKSLFSQLAYRNLADFGFTDRTWLVNRRGAETHGRPTVRSCADIGEQIDVAFLIVPQAGTLDALSDAAAVGIRNAVVLSSGYGEAGEAGQRAEAELVAHAESLGMVLLGPNHLGFANFTAGIPVTSIMGLPRGAGPVALLSQSGATSSTSTISAWAARTASSPRTSLAAAGIPADLDTLAAVVARIGDLAAALGDELESLEVNPLRVDGPTIEALDAVVTWRSV